MAREERKWNNRFIAYMDMIVNHPNYKGLPIKKKADGSLSWIATAKSEIGEERIEWCLEKADELGFERRAGVYADVMLAIHPTKWKVCQTCGREMSLYYHYPNANFVKALNKDFSNPALKTPVFSPVCVKLTHFVASNRIEKLLNLHKFLKKLPKFFGIKIQKFSCFLLASVI